MTSEKFSTLIVALVMGMTLSLVGCASGALKTDAALRGKKYETPEEALAAVKGAFRSEDPERLVEIFGEEGRDIIVSGDPVADKLAMRRASSRLEQRAELIPVKSAEHPNEQWYKLRFGREAWNMRIPLINRGQGWYFETLYAKKFAAETRREINEVKAVDTLVDLVAAQNRYQKQDYDGDGILEYAQRIISSPGAKDGLYWEAGGAEPVSPLDALAAKALNDGYGQAGVPRSYEGYVYKILPAQGKFARGGERSFLEQGNLTKGFAIVAYPLNWNVSGARTFVVGPNGTIYKKDVGFNSTELGSKMQEMNPDRTWVVVEHPD